MSIGSGSPLPNLLSDNTSPHTISHLNQGGVSITARRLVVLRYIHNLHPATHLFHPEEGVYFFTSLYRLVFEVRCGSMGMWILSR